MKNKWRIVLADNEPPLRSALRLLLEQEPDLMVVGEAANAQATIQQAITLQPDLLLLDWEIPGANGNGLVNVLHMSAPEARIIALSSRPEARRAALGVGAHAFVSKGDPPENLLEAIRRLQKQDARDTTGERE